MKNDKEIGDVYKEFRDTLLPTFNMVQDTEKQLLNQTNLLNKKKNYKRLRDLYDGYRQVVYKSWKLIYSDNNEFDNTIDNINQLVNGETMYGETKVAILVEQFFLSLYYSIISVMAYYEGVTKNKEVMNKIRYLSIKRMEDLMPEIEGII